MERKGIKYTFFHQHIINGFQSHIKILCTLSVSFTVLYIYSNDTDIGRLAFVLRLKSCYHKSQLIRN